MGECRIVRAWRNSGLVQLTVKPEPKRGRVAVVEFSPARICSGTHNFRPPTRAETIEAVQTVGTGLPDMGLSANLWNADLSRLDVCRNIETAEPLRSYWPIFEMREGKRVRKKSYGGTGFDWRNSCRELSIYDKIAEMKANGYPVNGLPGNVARFEYRLMRADAIRKAIDTGRLVSY